MLLLVCGITRTRVTIMAYGGYCNKLQVVRRTFARIRGTKSRLLTSYSAGLCGVTRPSDAWNAGALLIVWFPHRQRRLTSEPVIRQRRAKCPNFGRSPSSTRSTTSRPIMHSRRLEAANSFPTQIEPLEPAIGAEGSCRSASAPKSDLAKILRRASKRPHHSNPPSKPRSSNVRSRVIRIMHPPPRRKWIVPPWLS